MEWRETLVIKSINEQPLGKPLLAGGQICHRDSTWMMAVTPKLLLLSPSSPLSMQAFTRSSPEVSSCLPATLNFTCSVKPKLLATVRQLGFSQTDHDPESHPSCSSYHGALTLISLKGRVFVSPF